LAARKAVFINCPFDGAFPPVSIAVSSQNARENVTDAKGSAQSERFIPDYPYVARLCG
jgi:hypothetical protein